MSIADTHRSTGMSSSEVDVWRRTAEDAHHRMIQARRWLAVGDPDCPKLVAPMPSPPCPDCAALAERVMQLEGARAGTVSCDLLDRVYALEEKLGLKWSPKGACCTVGNWAPPPPAVAPDARTRGKVVADELVRGGEHSTVCGQFLRFDDHCGASRADCCRERLAQRFNSERADAAAEARKKAIGECKQIVVDHPPWFSRDKSALLAAFDKLAGGA